MTTETITPISVDQLHESPFNPRKTFTDITELATNILAEGRIHQPLLVRPITPNPLRDDIVDGYEVVFGHRRLRAAEAAGLTHVPCMVRAMTNAEARSAQVAENLARADVHPIEEAEGFALMIEQDGVSADDLATKLGKSRSYVYGRLKLLAACPEIHKACLAGEIGSEVALLVARLRTPKLQEKALAAIRNDTSQHSRLDDGGKKSFRHIRDLLAEKFTLDLKSAIFDREDATLLPDAGTCSACPKRTGNAPEFQDLAAPTRDATHHGYSKPGGPNTCTDPDCFDAKKRAHLERAAQQLAKDGATVVTGNKARASISATGDVKGDFIALDDVKKMMKAGKAKPLDVAVVSIQDPRTGKVKKAVKRAELVTAGVLKPDQAKAPGVDHAANEARRQAEHKRQQAKAEEETRARMALLQAVRQAAQGRPRTTFELRMVTAAALAGVGYQARQTLTQLHGKEDMHELQVAIDTMDADALTALLLDCAIIDEVAVQAYNLGTKPRPLLALAEHYGIDALAVMQASAPPPAEPASTPSTAGASAKKAAAASAKTKAKLAGGPVKYRCPMTGSTWSGRGLRPAWINAAIAGGKSLSDFEVKPEAKANKVKDGAGVAGGRKATAAASVDLFAGEPA